MTIPASPASAKDATVYILSPLHPAAEKHAERTFARVVRPNQDGMSHEDCLRVAHAMLIRLGGASRADLDIGKNIRIIARNGTGLDSMDLDACRDKGVVVTNRKGGNAPEVAELAFTMMLALLRRVKEVDQRITSGELLPSLNCLAPGLIGKTVGLVGMGDTAYELSRFLAPFRCRLLVYSPTSPRTRWTTADKLVVEHTRVDSLEELLREVDVLSLHCPLTPATRGMLGERELRTMKPTAVVVNISRGGIIDEEALAQVLKDGRLGGAGIDCWRVEPAHGATLGELGKLNNVICLPHVGASTDHVQRTAGLGAVETVRQFFDGEEISGRVI